MIKDNSVAFQLERATLQALPAIANRYYDGWLLRFNKGYTRRGNAVYPIYGKPNDVNLAIQHCEAQYNAVKLPARFKLSQVAQPTQLDDLLDKRGYTPSIHTSVQWCELNTMYSVEEQVTIQRFNADWFHHFTEWNQLDEEMANHAKRTLSFIRNAHFAILHDEEQPVALGYGVLQEMWFGLFGILTQPEARGKGHGQRLVKALLAHGQAMNAQCAYLQVNTDNEPALHLYKKLGFTTSHNYWYRTKT